MAAPYEGSPLQPQFARRSIDSQVSEVPNELKAPSLDRVPNEDLRASYPLGSQSLGTGSRAFGRGSVSLWGSDGTRSTIVLAGGVEDGSDVVREPWNKVALRFCERLLSNPLFLCFTTVLTVWVLIGDDLRLICFEADADRIFDYITLGCLFFFTGEMMLTCLVQEDYFPGFWFAMDLFATASLILDLTFVSQALMDYPPISSDVSQEDSQNFEESDYARASRSSRVGSRIARVLRVLRLARLAMAVQVCTKALSACMARLSRRSGSSTMPGDAAIVSEHLSEDNGAGAESRVGKKLSERTPQRVITIVLVILFVAPALQPGVPEALMPISAEYGAQVVYQAWNDLEWQTALRLKSDPGDVEAELADSQSSLWQWRRAWERQVMVYINAHLYDDWAKLCWVGIVRKREAVVDKFDMQAEAYLMAIARHEVLEDSELGHMTAKVPKAVMDRLGQEWATDCSEDGVRIMGVSFMDGVDCPHQVLRPQATRWYKPIVHNSTIQEEHLYGQFVEFVFVFDLRHHIQVEAGMGILRTVLIVIILAVSALLFSRDVDKLVLHPIERMISKVDAIRKDPLYAIRHGGPSQAEAQMKMGAASLETQVLENTIIKLGSLLALGFGEAGVAVIAENLDDANSQVTAKVAGNKVEAIFGFCDVRDFTTTTEVLKESTMVFVNQVAEIVHRVVDRHLGAANKNLGQAFLLVWQFSHFERRMRPKLADLSVLAFIQVVSELSRDRQLAKLCQHPLFVCRNFKVSLGFGLHLGWAIAGAIGSEFKIDASYLSPHVNLTSQLEAATSEYGVTILMSEPLVRACNSNFRRHFRPVDHVQLTGSTRATQLFTVDLDTTALFVDRTTKTRSLDRHYTRQLREERRKEVLSDSFEAHRVLMMDRHMRRMRQHLFLRFFQEFECGFLNYLAGEWGVAAQRLRLTRKMLKTAEDLEDGPSNALLTYMEGFNFEAPAGWPGWRELTV